MLLTLVLGIYLYYGLLLIDNSVHSVPMWLKNIIMEYIKLYHKEHKEHKVGTKFTKAFFVVTS